MVAWFRAWWRGRPGVDVLSPSGSWLEQFAAVVAYHALRLAHPHWRVRYRVSVPTEAQCGVVGLVGIGHGTEGEPRFGDRASGSDRDVTPADLPHAYPDLRWIKLWACYQGRFLGEWAAAHPHPVRVLSRRGRCFGPFPWPPERRASRLPSRH